MANNVEHIVSKGVFGTVTSRLHALVTKGWFDEDESTGYEIPLTRSITITLPNFSFTIK